MQLRTSIPLVLTLASATAQAQTTLYRYADNATPGVGWSVRGVGDLDGDGVREVAVASYNVECGFGGCLPAGSRIVVLSGAQGSLLYGIVPALNDGAGASLDTLGDLDGDGVRELLVGAPYFGGQFSPSGAVRIHSGATGLELRTIVGPNPYAYLGQSVAGVDDFDGDGFDDVAGATWSGVHVYSSVTGFELLAIPSPALSPSQTVVARYSDWNNDGRDDFLVGFADYDLQGTGVVQIRSGANGAILQTFAPATAEPTFGWSLSPVGDQNGDGRTDVIVGAPQFDIGAGSRPGFVEVYSADGARLRRIDGVLPGSHLGFAVGGGLDVSGDSRPDLVVASSCSVSGQFCARQAFVYDGVSGAKLAVIDSAFTGFGGVSVDMVGDLTGDLLSEVAFGSSCTQPFTDCGVATVFTTGAAGASTYCTSGISTNGCSAHLNATGVASASAPSGFTLRAIDVEGQRQSLFFYGVTGRDALPWGASSSFLCVKTPTQRTTVLSSGGSIGQCDGAVQLDWLAFIANTPGVLGAPFQGGDVVNAQLWYRDPPSSKSTHLSNGLEFTLAP